jgi:23S rRNA pseudouridine2604 synthase
MKRAIPPAGQRPLRTAPVPAKAPPVDDGERLAKKVALMVPCSRREAEQYIEGGWVKVNGKVVEEPQHRVSTQAITIDPNASLINLTPVTLVLNKPPGLQDARSLLTVANHYAQDASGIKVLKRHFANLESSVPLENGASGLVVFTQDWRTERKLTEDIAQMEHELMVEVAGEIEPDALKPIHRALHDDRLALPVAKVSINSTTPERSRLRFAVKGAHPGFAAYLCELAKLELLAMRRVRLGRVAVGDLPVGQWRYMATHERF